MSGDLSCPMCGTHLDLGHLLVDAENRTAFLRMIESCGPIGAVLMRYVQLFTPPKTSLTPRKQARILLQLLPDIERHAITNRGRDWSVPMPLWEQAIDQMLVARDAGKLELPMTGHKYLYAILTSLADKAEAGTEAQAEAAKRAAPSTATFTVRGQTMGMGQALDQVFGGKNPVLAKLDAEKGRESRMPDALQKRLADLKKPGAKP